MCWCVVADAVSGVSGCCGGRGRDGAAAPGWGRYGRGQRGGGTQGTGCPARSPGSTAFRTPRPADRPAAQHTTARRRGDTLR